MTYLKHRFEAFTLVWDGEKEQPGHQRSLTWPNSAVTKFELPWRVHEAASQPAIPYTMLTELLWPKRTCNQIPEILFLFFWWGEKKSILQKGIIVKFSNIEVKLVTCRARIDRNFCRHRAYYWPL